MAETYDVVFAGGGHNALSAAAYLAKAGVNVCVVEKNPYVGGGVVTQELAAPGFKADLCSIVHILNQPNPLLLNDELGLKSKYGLEYVFPEVQMCVHFDDGDYMLICLPIEKTVESIAKFSQKDAEQYFKFYKWAEGALDMMVAGMYDPPPPLGDFFGMLGQSPEGRGLMRALMLSTQDIIDEWFEHPKVRMGMTRWIAEIMLHPKTKGTGLTFFLMIPLLHKYGGGMPIGGSGEFSIALEKFILDNGGTIKTNALIKEFKIESGEAKGLILDTGEEILGTKAVVGGLHIKQMFPTMTGDAKLPDGFVESVDRLKTAEYVNFTSHYALNEPPKFKVGSEIVEAFLVEFAPADMETYLRYFDDMVYYGTANHWPMVAVPTIHDPSRAPAGKHDMYFYEFAPWSLKDGGPDKWLEIKEQYADEMLEFLRQYTTNMTSENIIGRWICSPPDLQEHNPSMWHGDFCHLAPFLDQSMGNRPLPDYNFKSPIDKLYMCGPCTYPGVGATGGGRVVVQVIMQDLGIDFKKVIA